MILFTFYTRTSPSSDHVSGKTPPFSPRGHPDLFPDNKRRKTCVALETSLLKHDPYFLQLPQEPLRIRRFPLTQSDGSLHRVLPQTFTPGFASNSHTPLLYRGSCLACKFYVWVCCFHHGCPHSKIQKRLISATFGWSYRYNRPRTLASQMFQR